MDSDASYCLAQFSSSVRGENNRSLREHRSMVCGSNADHNGSKGWAVTVASLLRHYIDFAIEGVAEIIGDFSDIKIK